MSDVPEGAMTTERAKEITGFLGYEARLWARGYDSGVAAERQRLHDLEARIEAWPEKP